MEKAVLKVDGMSCEHCAAAVTKGLGALGSVSNVAVDLGKKTVSFEHDPAVTTIEKIKSEIEALGYENID